MTIKNKTGITRGGIVSTIINAREKFKQLSRNAAEAVLEEEAVLRPE